MNRVSLICGIAVAFQPIAFVLAEAANEQQNVTEIPLDRVWGYNLPGTRDIAGIPLPEGQERSDNSYAALRSERERNIETIRRALSEKAPLDRALPGFVYPRHPDFYTLRPVASQLLADAKNRRRRQPLAAFQSGKEYTLVFFSHPSSYYTRMRKIERNAGTITIYYQFEPHTTQESTVHFAIIPLGKLSEGDYNVEFRRIAEDKKYRDHGFKLVDDASTIVCNSFSFSVHDRPKYASESPSAGATIIPINQIWAYRMPGTKPVQELDKLEEAATRDELNRSPVFQIANALSTRINEDEAPLPAFVVPGVGKEALENAAFVFEGKEQLSATFSTDEDLTLVFHARESGWYIHLVSVEKLGSTIRIKYRPVSHITSDVTKHFALIPLGKLNEGTYQVLVECLEPTSNVGTPHTNMFESWRLVAQDFMFQVRKEP